MAKSQCSISRLVTVSETAVLRIRTVMCYTAGRRGFKNRVRHLQNRDSGNRGVAVKNRCAYESVK